jgi:hypothetical protein
VQSYTLIVKKFMVGFYRSIISRKIVSGFWV